MALQESGIISVTDINTELGRGGSTEFSFGAWKDVSQKWVKVSGAWKGLLGNVYSGGSDNTVRKINSRGDQVWSFTGHSSAVLAVAVDTNGNVYSTDSINTVRKINSSGNQVWSFTGHTDSVYDVAVDTDGNVYSASLDGTVRKIDSSGSEVWNFTGHGSSVYAVAVG